jgi:hypothetical protein
MSVKNKFERGKYMTDNKPVHSMSYGSIQVAIWQQKTDLGGFYNVCFNKIYKHEDSWGSSRYFSEFDLCLLSKAVLDAHTWIQNHKQEDVVQLSLPAVRDVEETEEFEQ